MGIDFENKMDFAMNIDWQARPGQHGGVSNNGSGYVWDMYILYFMQICHETA